MSLAGVGPRVVVREVLVSIKPRVLRGFGENEGVVVEGYGLDHVDRQQVMEWLFVQHLLLHTFGNALKKMLVGLKCPQ